MQRFKICVMCVFLVIFSLLIFNPTAKSTPVAEAAPPIQTISEGEGLGYTYHLIRVEGQGSGEGVNMLIDMPFPENAAEVEPICAIMTYWAEGDKDMGWNCEWDEGDLSSSGPFVGNVEVNASLNHSEHGYVEIVVILLDKAIFNVDRVPFTVRNNFQFETTLDLVEVNGDVVTNRAIPLITITQYESGEDDDFGFSVDMTPNNSQESITISAFEGNRDSRISGFLYRIEPLAPCSAEMAMCWDIFGIRREPFQQRIQANEGVGLFTFTSLITYNPHMRDVFDVATAIDINDQTIEYFFEAADEGGSEPRGSAEWQTIILSIPPDGVLVPFDAPTVDSSATDIEPFSFTPITLTVDGEVGYEITNRESFDSQPGQGQLIIDDPSGSTYSVHVSGEASSIWGWTGSGSFAFDAGSYDIRIGEGIVGQVTVNSGEAVTILLDTGRLEVDDPGVIAWSIRKAGAAQTFWGWTGDFGMGLETGNYEIVVGDRLVASFNIRRETITTVHMPTGRYNVSDPGSIAWSIREVGAAQTFWGWTGPAEFGVLAGNYEILVGDQVVRAFHVSTGQTTQVDLPTGRLNITTSGTWSIAERDAETSFWGWTGSAEFGFLAGDYDVYDSDGDVTPVTIRTGEVTSVTLD